MATSPTTAGAPVPSTMRAWRTTRSCMASEITSVVPAMPNCVSRSAGAWTETASIRLVAEQLVVTEAAVKQHLRDRGLAGRRRAGRSPGRVVERDQGASGRAGSVPEHHQPLLGGLRAEHVIHLPRLAHRRGRVHRVLVTWEQDGVVGDLGQLLREALVHGLRVTSR